MLHIPAGPSSETAVSPTATPGEFVVGIDTSVFVQCIFRPYTRRAKQMGAPSSSLPVSPENSPTSNTTKEDAAEVSANPVDTAVDTVPSDDRPVTPVDDKSDDSIVVIRGMTSFEETEGVKRRWFRDDMRQSPVNALWSVGSDN